MKSPKTSQTNRFHVVVHIPRNATWNATICCRRGDHLCPLRAIISSHWIYSVIAKSGIAAEFVLFCSHQILAVIFCDPLQLIMFAICWQLFVRDPLKVSRLWSLGKLSRVILSFAIASQSIMRNPLQLSFWDHLAIIVCDHRIIIIYNDVMLTNFNYNSTRSMKFCGKAKNLRKCSV